MRPLDSVPSSAARHRALASPVRVHVVDALRATPDQDATQLADRLGLHANTVRTHLRVLEEAGLVVGSAESRSRPGRPRLLYRLTDEATGESGGSYVFLATVLAGVIDTSTHDARSVAEEAGRAWGAHVTDAPAPFTRISVDDAVARLRDLLAALGFAPQLVAAEDRLQFRLHRCPFVEVAHAHPDVVCAVHLGLMRGALDALGADVDAETLEPWAEPDVCVATLRPLAVPA
ncbi:MAG: helix-turn-helix domain-containing protein [Nitriliruptoraceae bacterium]